MVNAVVDGIGGEAENGNVDDVGANDVDGVVENDDVGNVAMNVDVGDVVVSVAVGDVEG